MFCDPMILFLLFVYLFSFLWLQTTVTLEVAPQPQMRNNGLEHDLLLEHVTGGGVEWWFGPWVEGGGAGAALWGWDKAWCWDNA